MTSKIDEPLAFIKQVADKASQFSRAILNDLLPNGKLEGVEWVCKNPTRFDKKQGSFKVNVNTCKWSDFAENGKGGGDLVSLWAYLHNCDNLTAAKQLSDNLNLNLHSFEKQEKVTDYWKPIVPVPNDAYPPKFEHKEHGQPDYIHIYKDYDGNVLGYQCRYDLSNGNKQFRSFTFCQNDDGKRLWRWKWLSTPRPIYKQELLKLHPEAKVIFVEGEKCADAGNSEFENTNEFIFITCSNGAGSLEKSDFSKLKGREIYFWHDNDKQLYNDKHEKAGQLMPPEEQPSRKMMVKLSQDLSKENKCYLLNYPTIEYKNKWDVADLVEDAFDAKDDIIEFVKKYSVESKKQKKEPDNKPQTSTQLINDHERSQFKGFFKAVGYSKGGMYHFFSRMTNMVVDLTPSKLTPANLIQLAPLSFWEEAFTIEGKKSRAKFDLESAQDMLLRTCEMKGVYDASKERGRGAWWDEGRSVFHYGKRLSIDGVNTKLFDIDSNYVYEASKDLKININDCASKDEAKPFIELCNMIDWKRDTDGFLLAGWCVISIIGGALDWRPHIWITGGANSGKSWVVSKIVETFLGNMGLAMQSSTSEAGLRQGLGNDSIPVVFDEIESTDKAKREMIQKIMELVRASSSMNSAPILKGTADHKVKSFVVRSCFCFASINFSASEVSDQQRITVLEMSDANSISKAKRQENYKFLQATRDRLLSDQYCERMRARSITMIPKIRRSAEVFKQVMTTNDEFSFNGRMADQIGLLLAGCFSLKSDMVITEEEAYHILKKFDFTNEREAYEDISDEQKCLNIILQSKIKLKDGILYSAAELLRILQLQTAYEISGFYNEQDHKDQLKKEDLPDYLQVSEIKGAISREGIKYYKPNNGDIHYIGICKNHTSINKLLNDTPYAFNYDKTLLRFQGSMAKKARFSSMAQAGVFIPADVLEDTTEPIAAEELEF